MAITNHDTQTSLQLEAFVLFVWELDSFNMPRMMFLRKPTLPVSVLVAIARRAAFGLFFVLSHTLYGHPYTSAFSFLTSHLYCGFKALFTVWCIDWHYSQEHVCQTH